MSGDPSITDDVRALAAASMDGVGVVDDDVFVHANRALAAMYGLPDADAVVGRSWRRLYPAEERERLADEVLPRVGAGGGWCGATTGRRADGSVFEQRLSVRRTPGGRLLWVVRERADGSTPDCGATAGATAAAEPTGGAEGAQSPARGEDDAAALLDGLTDRQREVLVAAYRVGYFDWPRERTAEEVADSLDIAAPTLHAHIRKAESSLLAALFDERKRRR